MGRTTGDMKDHILKIRLNEDTYKQVKEVEGNVSETIRKALTAYLKDEKVGKESGSGSKEDFERFCAKVPKRRVEISSEILVGEGLPEVETDALRLFCQMCKEHNLVPGKLIRGLVGEIKKDQGWE